MKGWKTIVFNVLAAILPVLETADLTDVLGPQGMAIYAGAITIANIVLRAFTNTPIGKAN